MDEIVDMVFQLAGLQPGQFPMNLQELTPWLTRVTVACAVISGVFRFIGKLIEIFFEGFLPPRHWR